MREYSAFTAWRGTLSGANASWRASIGMRIKENKEKKLLGYKNKFP